MPGGSLYLIQPINKIYRIENKGMSLKKAVEDVTPDPHVKIKKRKSPENSDIEEEESDSEESSSHNSDHSSQNNNPGAENPSNHNEESHSENIIHPNHQLDELERDHDFQREPSREVVNDPEIDN